MDSAEHGVKQNGVRWIPYHFENESKKIRNDPEVEKLFEYFKIYNNN